MTPTGLELFQKPPVLRGLRSARETIVKRYVPIWLVSGQISGYLFTRPRPGGVLVLARTGTPGITAVSVKAISE